MSSKNTSEPSAKKLFKKLEWHSPPPLRSKRFANTPDESFKLDDQIFYPNFDINVYMRTCEKEIVEPLIGKTIGSIPNWINGSLIRNGVGSLKVGNNYFGHLFDGSALIHRFGIENGSITYQCRFLQSETFKKNSKANRIMFTEYGTQGVPDPCHTIFDRVAALFNPNSKCTSDNSVLAIYPFGDQVYACGEIPIIHQLNPKTLETEKSVPLTDYVSIVHNTSHPHVTADGTYNLAVTLFKTGPYHAIVKYPFDANGDKMIERGAIVATMPVRWPSHPPYMHSYGITDNYFVIIEQPLGVSLPQLLVDKALNKPLAGCLRWYEDETTLISLIDRKTGQVTHRFHADAFSYLHVINQYEIGDEYVVLDICIYKDPSIVDCMYIDAMKSMHHNANYAKMFRSKPVRFVLPLNPAEGAANLINLKNTNAEAHYSNEGEIFVLPEKLSNFGCETPRINSEHYLGKPYKYFYAISSDVDAENPGTIIKIDTETKEAKRWCEKNCYPSEPVFVPRPNGTDEDDGVILSALVWGQDDTNHVGLIVLDAKTFKEIGRSEFDTPGPVPKCLHGWFIPDK